MANVLLCTLLHSSLTGVLGKSLDSAGRKAAAERGKKRRVELVIGEVFC